MKTLAEILQRKPTFKAHLALEFISFIDLTSLNNTDQSTDILPLIEKANAGFQGFHPAAVCTYSNFGHLQLKYLKKEIKSAVVGGCFPTGQTLSAVKIIECEKIAETGISEIDIVINRGDFFAQDLHSISNEISAIKKRLKGCTLKVILETGELKTNDNIYNASKTAINAGADFLKTSTGKTAIGATPEAVYIMAIVIKEHFDETGIEIGLKVSGGIRTFDQAAIYYQIVKDILGINWLTSEKFRIGASSLYSNLIDNIQDSL